MKKIKGSNRRTINKKKVVITNDMIANGFMLEHLLNHALETLVFIETDQNIAGLKTPLEFDKYKKVLNDLNKEFLGLKKEEVTDDATDLIFSIREKYSQIDQMTNKQWFMFINTALLSVFSKQRTIYLKYRELMVSQTTLTKVERMKAMLNYKNQLTRIAVTIKKVSSNGESMLVKSFLQELRANIKVEQA